MDKLKELSMSKKRDHKIMITDIAISKISEIKCDYISEEDCKNLQKLSQQVLFISKHRNESNEIAMTYRLGTRLDEKIGEQVGLSFGTEHSVDPLQDTISYHMICSAKACEIVLLHNHPSLSKFSLKDIQFFLRQASLKMMIMVTNAGSISYLVKTNKYTFSEATKLCNKAIELHNEASNLKEFQVATEFFLRRCYNVGIRYESR